MFGNRVLGIGSVAKRLARGGSVGRGRVLALEREDSARPLDVVDVRAEQVRVALMQFLEVAFCSSILVLEALGCESEAAE